MKLDLAFFYDLPVEIQVLAYASMTALATGLGTLPVAFLNNKSEKWNSLGSAFAGGLMLTASFMLIEEGLQYQLWRLLAGVLTGAILIYFSFTRLKSKSHFSIGKLKGASALQALMIVGVMTLHSFAEGVGVGVSFGGREGFGQFISAAIAIHNIPEGLAITLILKSRGVSLWKCAGWAVFSSLPQPILAVPSFMFVETFEPFLPFGLGLAAGAMVWMVVAELIPDAFENANKQSSGLAVVAGVILMIFLQEII